MRLFNFGRAKNDTSDWIQHFLALKSDGTQRQYRTVIKEFVEHCKSRGIDYKTATHTDAMQFATLALNKKGEKPRDTVTGGYTVTRATVLRKAIILAGLYKPFVEPAKNPFLPVVERLRGAKVGEKRSTQVLSAEQVKRMLDAPRPFSKIGIRDKAFLGVLFGGGLRVSEATQLRICDVLEAEGITYLNLRKTKAQERQEQTLPNWAANLVDALISQRRQEQAQPGDSLFIKYSPLGIPSTKIDSRYAHRHFKRLCVDAGIPPLNYSPHSARATACTRLLESGADYKAAKEYMRHSSFEMVEAYDKRRLKRSASPALKLSY